MERAQGRRRYVSRRERSKEEKDISRDVRPEGLTSLFMSQIRRGRGANGFP